MEWLNYHHLLYFWVVAREGSVAKVARTKETALVLARELIARIRGGASMESLVAEFSDDRGDDGKPFNSGSYTIARNTPTVATLKNAAFGLAVGELAPEPIDSGSAIHVIRRDD